MQRCLGSAESEQPRPPSVAAASSRSLFPVPSQPNPSRPVQELLVVQSLEINAEVAMVCTLANVQEEARAGRQDHPPWPSALQLTPPGARDYLSFDQVGWPDGLNLTTVSWTHPSCLLACLDSFLTRSTMLIRAGPVQFRL
jgi:hypothetical protein